MCVRKVHTANHLVISPLRQVCVFQNYTTNHLFELSEPLSAFTHQTSLCVPKVHTANHLFELSEPLSVFTPQTNVCVLKVHSEPLI